MSYTGKEKALILLAQLGDNADQVLALLEPSSADILTSAIENAPVLDDQQRQVFLSEVISEAESRRAQSASVESGSELSELAGPELLESDSDEDQGALDEAVTAISDEHAMSDEPGSSELESTEEAQDTSDEEVSSEPSKVKRSSEQIATLLADQQVQISAFFLMRLEESERDEIMDALPESYRDEVLARNVERIPLSDRVFDRLFEKIAYQDPEEAEQDAEEDFF
ncbi:MAG: hypothetical protein CL521_00545 [Actinobacteria bacterium]|nr:hypothetical protein [Actinomycetota bacterium]